MAWRKLGLIFSPENLQPWMISHAALPVPVQLEGDRYRFFFSTRNAQSQSSVGYIDLDLSRPNEVLSVSERAVLSPGSAGMYDDCGVGLGTILRDVDDYRMYYMGWNLGTTVPWRNSIGLAIGNPTAAKFLRFSEGPIVDRSPADPFTVSYPWVMKIGPCNWHMWYGSNLAWGKSQSDMNHVIKHATSLDGINWERDGKTALGFKDDTEYAMARPTVLYENGTFRMWFAYRGDKYRIGYAESKDATTWQRLDEAVGIDLSPTGWDSEMICYPCVFKHAGQRFMAYNGNGYGRSGFGLAVYEP